MFKLINKDKVAALFLFVLTTILLFLGFYRNQWQSINNKKFRLFQKDSESYVVARMSIARQDGFLSHGGLLGWGDIDPENINETDYDHQFDIYLNSKTFVSYWAKQSHPGFQALFFSFLDLLSPFKPAQNLRFFYLLNSGLFALTLAGIVIWFYQTFGWLSALSILGSSLAAQWLTLFARNLFFVTWVFYFPMLFFLFWFKFEDNGPKFTNNKIFWITFTFVLFKCLLNGYDFILPFLGMLASPIVFYGLAHKWQKHTFTQRFTAVILASLLAILSSFMVLLLQALSITGDPQTGINFIISTIYRRTYSPANVPDPARTASIIDILKIYLSESYLFQINLSFLTLILIFAGFSILYWFSRKWRQNTRIYLTTEDALVLTTWFTIISPLSWYMIFKSLAYYHTHMNYLPWHMPFTIFGFGMCGFILEKTLGKLNIPTKLLRHQA